MVAERRRTAPAPRHARDRLEAELAAAAAATAAAAAGVCVWAGPKILTPTTLRGGVRSTPPPLAPLGGHSPAEACWQDLLGVVMGVPTSAETFHGGRTGAKKMQCSPVRPPSPRGVGFVLFFLQGVDCFPIECNRVQPPACNPCGGALDIAAWGGVIWKHDGPDRLLLSAHPLSWEIRGRVGHRRC